MKPNTTKDAFKVKKKYKERFQRWGAEKGYAILMAMFEYEETGEVDLPDEYLDAFEPIKEDLDAMSAKYEEVCERNRRNGQNGGRPKKTEWEDEKPNETEKTHSVSQKPKKPDIDTDIDTETDNKKKSKKVCEVLFDRFWTAYPRKVAKQTAFKAFSKLPIDEPMLEKMLNAIEVQKRSEQWQDERYIPHPATWLNQGRWDDEPPKPKKGYGDYMQRTVTVNDRFGFDYLKES